MEPENFLYHLRNHKKLLRQKFRMSFKKNKQDIIEEYQSVLILEKMYELLAKHNNNIVKSIDTVSGRIDLYMN